jgi:hypothetical protein
MGEQPARFYSSSFLLTNKRRSGAFAKAGMASLVRGRKRVAQVVKRVAKDDVEIGDRGTGWVHGHNSSDEPQNGQIVNVAGFMFFARQAHNET